MASSQRATGWRTRLRSDTMTDSSGQSSSRSRLITRSISRNKYRKSWRTNGLSKVTSSIRRHVRSWSRLQQMKSAKKSQKHWRSWRSRPVTPSWRSNKPCTKLWSRTSMPLGRRKTNWLLFLDSSCSSKEKTVSSSSSRLGLSKSSWSRKTKIKLFFSRR